MTQELDPPAATLLDSNAVELLRVWAASGKQHVAMRTDRWEDPGAWGILLVDLAHHIANAYSQTGGPDKREALARIRSAFDAEWNTPTDSPTGSHMSLRCRSAA